MSQYDDERTTALQRHGIVVLRIPNELLIRDAEIVEQQIQYAIATRNL